MLRDAQGKDWAAVYVDFGGSPSQPAGSSHAGPTLGTGPLWPASRSREGCEDHDRYRTKLTIRPHPKSQSALMSPTLVARHIRPLLLEALAESRAAALLGARQVGKSTLVRELSASDYRARFITLDDELTANAARADATGFVAEIEGPAVIDEIQRVPGLLLAIKQRLDSNQARGQFLLTGSANILTLPTVADALPGRVEYVNLWPFSQGELSGRREEFIDRLFAGRFPRIAGAPVGRASWDSTRIRSPRTRRSSRTCSWSAGSRRGM